MTTNFELAATPAYQPWNHTAAKAVDQTRTADSTAAGQPAITAFGQDTSSLSATGLLSAPSLTQDDSRAAHVTAIGQSIAAGTYFVSAYDVASSIIDSLF